MADLEARNDERGFGDNKWDLPPFTPVSFDTFGMVLRNEYRAISGDDAQDWKSGKSCRTVGRTGLDTHG